MAAPLRRVLVCPPDAAGWSDPERASRWRDLGFQRAPDPSAAREQHAVLCARLREAGAEVERLPASRAFSLDAVYAHDASFPTDRGMIVLRPGKESRRGEAGPQAEAFRRLGVPVVATMAAPATAEAGDLVWLDGRTVLAGRGHRTNDAGIAALRAWLAPDGVDVIEAPLPHGAGPAECLHLMSLLSVLDEASILVDLAWLAVPTVELLRARGLRLLPIDPSERETMACNVLALGRRRLLALEENRRTNDALRAAGFDVRTFPGTEIAQKGRGGPTCLTRPLLRG
jgi:N-dimethylarginine dimethylaminohydrolase